jgi:NDP-sugar pyrophosphorylase family protein
LNPISYDLQEIGMENLDPNYFFDHSKFKHKDIFASCSFVWDVIPKIKKYLEKHTLGLINVDIPNGAYLINPELISIGKGSTVEPGAYIKGPCIIGENCTVRHGAYLRGHVITGNSCVLGHDSEFKNALLLDEAHAGHFAYVGDSILGNRVNLGAGTICSNLKLDRGQISIKVNGNRLETGLRKFGAVIGDDSQTGCNSVTNPGTLLGKGVFCYPCINFGGFVPMGYVVRSEAKVIISKK